MNGLLAAIIAACTAYSDWVRWQREIGIDSLEDEIDRLATIGDAASLLRMERLGKRLKCKRQLVGSI